MTPLSAEDIQARQQAVQLATAQGGFDLSVAQDVYRFLTAEDPLPDAQTLQLFTVEGEGDDVTVPLCPDPEGAPENMLTDDKAKEIAQAFLRLCTFEHGNSFDRLVFRFASTSSMDVEDDEYAQLSDDECAALRTLLAACEQADTFYG